MPVAIITGASAGLGSKFLKHMSKVYPEIDEYWVIARRIDKLEAYKEQYPDKKVVPLSYDLSKEETYPEFQAYLKEMNPDVKLLINNAGVGDLGDFATSDYPKQMLQCNLNVRGLTVITNLVLKYMKEGSAVINVASIASFVPNANMAVYCSTKAYVVSFSRAIRFELKKRRINVLAVCPGPMATEFLDVANITGRSKTFETLPYCKPDDVAYKSLKAAKKGKGIYTNKLFFKFYRILAKILPHRWLMYFAKT